MKKIHFSATLAVAAIAMCSSVLAHAQNKLSDASISGHIIDSKTGEHLPYVMVMVGGTQIGIQTSSSGHYAIRNLPLGKHDIIASFVGYKDSAVSMDIEAGKTYEVNFSLEPESLSLDGVVVSATRNRTSRKMAPALVNVIDSRIFASTSSPTLAEGLTFQRGVLIEHDCQNCGFTQARINGLDGHYSQILIDSRPIFSALAGVYGLEQIPASMIDRVEVVRGGGSALFGASAIGGTINIITKEAMRSGAGISHELTSIGMSGALDNNTSVNASMVTDDGRGGLSVFGQRRSRDGYDADGDGFTEIPALNTITIGTRGHLRLNSFSKLKFEYHGVKEFRRGGDQLDRPAHEALIAEQTEHINNSGSLSYEGQSQDGKHIWNAYVSAQHISRNSYYGSGMDPKAYGRTTDLTAVGGVQYSYKFNRLLFMPSQLTAGLEYNFDDMKDKSLGYGYKTAQKINIIGSYFQNEWKNEHWGLLGGVRIDKHDLIRRPIFSPRVNIRYSPFRDLSFRAIYAKGFRAPQAFDEDLHIAVAGGERIRIKLADNLREEKSHSFSASADWYHTFNNVSINLMAEGFYTMLKDTYSLRQTGDKADDGNSNIMERYNGSGSKVYGCTMEGKLAISTAFSLQAGLTIQRSRYDEAQAWSDDEAVAPVRDLFRSPNVYGYMVACYSPFKNFDIDLSGTYTGPMLAQHLKGSGTDVDVAVSTPSFWDMSCKISYEFNIMKICRLNLHAGVKNIFNAYQKDFDQGELRDSGYIYGPSLPRSLVVGMGLNF
ncbi:MAG: TonB-dependent receptor [Candidatus Cryptobacteroides sp.]|nr:TonB-dependent receptor [Candidatus Cryptobacteroides sp.]